MFFYIFANSEISLLPSISEVKLRKPLVMRPVNGETGILGVEIKAVEKRFVSQFETPYPIKEAVL